MESASFGEEERCPCDSSGIRENCSNRISELDHQGALEDALRGFIVSCASELSASDACTERRRFAGASARLPAPFLNRLSRLCVDNDFPIGP